MAPINAREILIGFRLLICLDEPLDDILISFPEMDF